MDEVYLKQIEAATNFLADRCRAYRAENAELIRTVERLESQYGVAVEQRDSARRLYCGVYAKTVGMSACEYAKLKGWDCFWNLSEDNNV